MKKGFDAGPVCVKATSYHSTPGDGPVLVGGVLLDEMSCSGRRGEGDADFPLVLSS